MAVEQDLLQVLQTSRTAQQFARSLATAYDRRIARVAIPAPATTGRAVLLEQALLPALLQANNRPDTVASAVVQGITVFWPGVPVPGGAVVAFLGGPALFVGLQAALSNPRSSAKQAAQRISACLVQATRLVQYVVPPGAPALLVLPF